MGDGENGFGFFWEEMRVTYMGAGMSAYGPDGRMILWESVMS
jgi:hypothetical protein